MYEGVILTLLISCIKLVTMDTTETLPFTEKPTLEIQPRSRDTHYISINWTLTDPNNVVENRWRITAEDTSLLYIASYEGEHNIDIVEQTGFVYVHNSDTKYNICLTAYLNQTVAKDLGYHTIQDCEVIQTIPKLLTSSLIPLILVLSFFVLLVLAGGINYKVKQLTIASHQYQKAEAAEAAEHQNGGVTFKTNNSNHIEA